MRDITWYFPETIEEARSLIIKEGIFPHGGGTGILRTGMRKIRGLVDLSALGLDYYRSKGNETHIGAYSTFNDVAHHAGQESILYEALTRSASTPLRNRITVGGSVSLFPVWSDIMGPLIALGAEVSIVGKHEGRFPVVDYARKAYLRKGTLITEVIVQKKNWKSSYHREIRTGFDYPAFTVTVLLRRIGGVIEDIRIVLVGCRGKFKRFTDIESRFRGEKISAVDTDGLGRDIYVDFNGKKFMSGEYIRHIAGVWVERAVAQVLE